MQRRGTRSRFTAGRPTGAILVLAVLLASAWYLAPSANDWLQGSPRNMQTVHATDNVNLRSGPGTTFDVLVVVPAGEQLSAEHEPVNGFSAVVVNGQHGWIATSYLARPGVAHAAESQVEVPAVEALVLPEPTSAPIQTTLVPAVEPPMPAPTAAPLPTSVPASIPVIAESTRVEAEPRPGEKWIEVNRTTRTVTLHNGEIVVASFDALIGKDLSIDGYYSTAVGTHYVHVKEKALVETPFADGVYLTDFVGFDPERSNGFHSPTRDAAGNVVVTGGTATLGCVRLSEADAQFLFDFASIGMRVDVHD